MSADLDKQIDRAVREMLDVEPRADMRARVIARIDARRVSFQLPVASFQRFAAVATIAALVVLALLATRHAEPPAQSRVATNGADVRLPAPDPVTAATTAKIGAREAPQAPTRVAYATSVDATPAAADIDPLKAIAPIEVAPIAQSSITPEPIAVRPLNPITEMQIAPLNPPDRRD